jgi:hypothetical protein
MIMAMSFVPSTTSLPDLRNPSPAWLRDLLGAESLAEGATFAVRGHDFVVRAGIPRSRAIASAAQTQTGDTFGFKWKKRDTFDSPASLARMRHWATRSASNGRSATPSIPLRRSRACGTG